MKEDINMLFSKEFLGIRFKGFLVVCLLSGSLAFRALALDIVPLKPGFEAILRDANDVPSVMMTLVILSAEAKEKKQPPPVYNLCSLRVTLGANYCAFNKGIPRAKMPQLIGKPIPGGKADQMVKEDKAKLDPLTGEVDLQAEFQEYLKTKKGYTITAREVKAVKLKATQSELVGGKVAGMWFTLKSDPNNSNIRAPIFVSVDNFVLDGHHRWAAVMATAFGLQDLKTVTMPTLTVSASIDQLLIATNEFLAEYGIQAKAG
jgi:hypothetical protein